VPCLAHLGEVQERLGDIRAAGGDVIAVTQSRPEVLAAHLRHEPRPFPTVCDPDRAIYRYFGLERGGWGMFFTPRALRSYVRLIASGWRPRAPKPGEDVFQRGGDFVLDANRRLIYAHRSTDPGDRPPAAVLVERIQAAAGLPSRIHRQ
jgi:hypothetical protein